MTALVDRFDRKIDYLRISITDRCNLRCRYCMPEEGVESIPHSEILRYEEIEQIVKAGSKLGITKIRITGGEPLVRKGSEELVRLLKKIPEIEEVALTTNGILLSQLGAKLARAGLDRVNISLDTLDPEKFKQITKFDKFNQVWQGIKTALEEDLTPVKLNVVVIKGQIEEEISDFVELAREYPLHIRFIEFMPGQTQGLNQAKGYLSMGKIKEQVSKNTVLQSTEVQGNGPAQYYKLSNGQGTIGFISPVSNHFCSSCNRLRLTSTGQLKPCLYSKQGVNVKKVIRKQGSLASIKAKFKQAVNIKPKVHTLTRENKIATNMSQIGG